MLSSLLVTYGSGAGPENSQEMLPDAQVSDLALTEKNEPWYKYGLNATEIINHFIQVLNIVKVFLHTVHYSSNLVGDMKENLRKLLNPDWTLD